ncbi:MAG: very short patch repair endonuclease [Candidatus Nanopelagicales bacterium]|nr:very short patch repair endonuclease [Candidatus Nanopelagicales bacterium]
MQAIRARDTRPELAIRRELHRRGLRYRVNVSVPGMPRRTIDVAWKGRRVAVFIDGCYWHGCREHSSAPKVNSDYWGPKIENNRRRDRETGQFLQERGWVVLRLWEHESVKEVADAIELCVRSRT